MINTTLIIEFKNKDRENTAVNNHLQYQRRTIACVMSYLEVLHWSPKSNGICRVNVEPIFQLDCFREPVIIWENKTSILILISAKQSPTPDKFSIIWIFLWVKEPTALGKKYDEINETLPERTRFVRANV